eukprot:SAG11_NODE_73_length_18072_cov_8.670005_5_plen_176_part_00
MRCAKITGAFALLALRPSYSYSHSSSSRLCPLPSFVLNHRFSARSRAKKCLSCTTSKRVCGSTASATSTAQSNQSCCCARWWRASVRSQLCGAHRSGLPENWLRSPRSGHTPNPLVACRPDPAERGSARRTAEGRPVAPRIVVAGSRHTHKRAVIEMLSERFHTRHLTTGARRPP